MKKLCFLYAILSVLITTIPCKAADSDAVKKLQSEAIKFAIEGTAHGIKAGGEALIGFTKFVFCLPGVFAVLIGLPATVQYGYQTGKYLLLRNKNQKFNWRKVVPRSAAKGVQVGIAAGGFAWICLIDSL